MRAAATIPHASNACSRAAPLPSKHHVLGRHNVCPVFLQVSYGIQAYHATFRIEVKDLVVEHGPMYALKQEQRRAA